MPKPAKPKQIRIRIAPERKAPRNLSFDEFSEWFYKEIREDNFEISDGNHTAVYEAAYKKYKYIQKQIPSGPLPQAIDIAAGIKGHKNVDIVACCVCEKFLIGVRFETDEKDFVYCPECAEKHLAECRSCHTVYAKANMVSLGNNTFRCRPCKKLRDKAISMLTKRKGLFSKE